MTCPPMTERYWGMQLEPYQKNGINFLVRDYAQAMRDISAEKGVDLIDVYRSFQQDPNRLDHFPDGLHNDVRVISVIMLNIILLAFTFHLLKKINIYIYIYMCRKISMCIPA